MAAPSRARRRPTVGDVAAAAAVSTPTVSKVLNGHTDVSSETRQRVLDAVDELGYVRRTPRMAVVRRSIEVMADQLSTPYAMEVLRGITDCAESLDVDVVVSRFHRAAPDTGWLAPGDWARRLSATSRTGAIILTAQLSPEHVAGLSQEHLPVVVIDPLNLTNPDVPSVGSTNFTGGMSATEHLVGLGHQHIAAIGGKPDSIAATSRVHGFRAALASAGLPIDESLVEFTGYDYDSGFAVADRWFRRGARPTAIFAASDTQAMGVLEAARQHGLDVPGDLSVVGYDDTYLAGWSTPPLTAVRQPLWEMGRVALTTVLSLATGEEPVSRHIELATELVVRGSTAPPRDSAPPRGTASPRGVTPPHDSTPSHHPE